MPALNQEASCWSNPRPGLLVRVAPTPGESAQGFWLREAACNGLNPRWTRRAATSGFHARVRLCPACLREARVWQTEWLAPDSFSCSVHRLWLADKCNKCWQDLRWSNVRYQHCRCGRDLRLLPQDPLPFALASGVDQMPRDVIDLVGTLSLHGLDGKPGKKASRVDVASIATRTVAGLGTLGDTKAGIADLLDRIRVAPSSAGTVQLLNEAFPSLKRRIEALSDEVWRRRLLSALERFVEASATTPNPIVGRNVECKESAPATVAQLAASVGVTPTRLAKTLDRMIDGAVATRVTSGGRVRRVVVGDQSKEIKEALAIILSCKAVGRRLGISAKRVSVLQSEGLLAPMTESGCQRFLACIPDAQFDRPPETVELSEALCRLVRVDRTAALVQALLAGTVRCWRLTTASSEVASLATWHVCRDEVKAWTCAAPEDDLSVPQAAKALGVKQEVAYHLIRRGLLNSTVRRGPARREMAVPRFELQNFSRRYSQLSKLASGAGVGSRGAFEWAQAQGHRIVCGPTIDGCRQYFVEVAASSQTTAPLTTGDLDD